MSFGERYNYQSRQRVKDGYTAQSSISFSHKDMALYKKIWLGLSAFDGVSVRYLNFEHSDRIALRNKTRLQAIEAAKDKAAHMAQALGVKLGKPLSLHEQSPAHAPFANRLGNVHVVAEQAAAPMHRPLGKFTLRPRCRFVLRLLNKFALQSS